MEKRQFIEEIAEIIEAEDASKLSMDSDFRESADYWSSLTGFSILIFMQDKCKAAITVDDFLKLNTIQDLYDAAAKGISTDGK